MVFAVDMVYLLIPCIGRLKVYIVDAFVFICSKSSFCEFACFCLCFDPLKNG